MAVKKERWAKIRKILEQAVQLPEEYRDSYLNETCGSDSSLRQEVDSLLAAEIGDIDFDQPLLNFETEPAPSNALVGQRIGSYRLIREIGRGGLAVVYLAANRGSEAARDRVAVKIIHRGMATDEVARRFQVEYIILSNLIHDNIARILDGGTTDDGLPYFVMEYVDGEPIDEYCDRHRLSTADRLRLMRKVCTSVHFAHQNLVVHRDIKPSNILVTKEGEPKLLDFGIAKILTPNSPLITRPFARRLTPDYASPEQVSGEAITTASDVYSLGVILYELLTGRRPYRLDHRFTEAIRETVCGKEPAEPSTAVLYAEGIRLPDNTSVTLTPEQVASTREGDPRKLHRRLLGDLDNIALMALRKDPQRRYSSAEQLSADLGRHLAGQPVLAQKDTLLYRVRKFIQRNKLGVGIAAAFLATIISSGVLLAVQHQETARQRDRAERVSDFLVDLFDASDPYASGGTEVTAVDLLELGQVQIAEGLQEDPATRAIIMTTMGKAYTGLGIYDKAESLLEEAVRIQEDMGSAGLYYARTLMTLGVLRITTRDYKAAEPLFARALIITRRELGDSDPEMSTCLDNLGIIYKNTSRFEEAEAAYLEALRVRENVLGPRHPKVAETVTSLAALYRIVERHEESEAAYLRSLSIKEASFGSDDPRLVTTLSNFARLFRDMARYEEAESLYRRALSIVEVRLGADHPQASTILNNLGVLLFTQERYGEAQAAYQRALKIRRARYGESNPKTAESLYNLGVLYGQFGDYEAAYPLLFEALEIRKAAYGSKSRLVAINLDPIGKFRERQGLHSEAEEFFREQLEIFEEIYGRTGSKYARALDSLGHNLFLQGRAEEAQQLFFEAIAIQREKLGNEHPELANILHHLGSLKRDQGALHEAERLFEEALSIRRSALGPAHSETLSTLEAHDEVRRRLAGDTRSQKPPS